jgi:murein tripeptide amidase MpaA
MKISSNFDSGNIDVISIENPENIQVNIRKDTHSDKHQWFYFRLTGAEGYPCKINIMNASSAAYPFWENYSAVASYDKVTWFRVPTQYKNNILTINHTPDYNSVFYAYFAPFTYEQHLKLVSTAQHSEICILESIGETVQGRDIDLLIAGDPTPDKKNIWIVARQHPGETMAEWFVQGLIARLFDEDDPVSKKILEKATFFIVPNMNLDGSILGNQRHNSLGVDLNREWRNPSLQKSPEVFFVKKYIETTGVDLFLDIHGDEEIPYNFVSGMNGIPNFNSKLENLQEKFLNNWMQVSPDFQREHGYPATAPGKANLDIGSKYIGNTFNCLSLTVEQPYKDNLNLPDTIFGWSPERAIKFGASILNSILFVIDDLR